LRDEALNHLEMLSIGRLPPDAVAKSEVRFGVPWRVIDDAARDSKPELVILTTKGLGGVQHVSLGRTAERVGTNAPAPVLIIAIPGHEPLSRVLAADELEQALSHRASAPSSKRRILVPIDFSSASEGVLHYAVSLADAFGADLTLLHVVDSGAAIRHESLGENEHDHYRLAEERLQELWRRRLPDSMRERVTLVFRTGVPWVEICAAARELAADWLFLTTEGFTNLRRVFLGKTADRVLRNAPCTVLVLREKEHHQNRPPGLDSIEGSGAVHRKTHSSAIPDRQQEATNAKSQASEA
jgi:nucleotide-binding universal stress UspA family protein